MEGPSLIIAHEEFERFLGRKIQAVTGVKAEELKWLKGKSITQTRSWGKHFLILIGERVLRIHFLMFGSYRFNSFREDVEPKLHLKLAGGDDINFYSCAIKEINGPIDDLYDWGVDIMSPLWDEKRVLKLMRANADEQVADVLMDQTLFAGSGNIIKNEVLFRLHLHPEALVRDLSPDQQRSLVRETRKYGRQFYDWKKLGKLKANWCIFRKRTCPWCALPVIKRPTGKLQRFSHYCENCQYMGALASNSLPANESAAAFATQSSKSRTEGSVRSSKDKLGTRASKRSQAVGLRKVQEGTKPQSRKTRAKRISKRSSAASRIKNSRSTQIAGKSPKH